MSGPRGAKGTSKYVHKLASTSKRRNFPKGVLGAISQAGQAKVYKYESVKVTHAAGPDYRDQRILLRTAQTQFIKAYVAVLGEFVYSGMGGLRMPPLSSGAGAGTLTAAMPHLTAESISMAHTMLTTEQRAWLLKPNIDLCMFEESELEAYERAVARDKEVNARRRRKARRPSRARAKAKTARQGEEAGALFEDSRVKNDKKRDGKHMEPQPKNTREKEQSIERKTDQQPKWRSRHPQPAVAVAWCEKVKTRRSTGGCDPMGRQPGRHKSEDAARASACRPQAVTRTASGYKREKAATRRRRKQRGPQRPEERGG
ncbi:hypothetical protein N9L19_01475 [bacterium]|nr:hypothetical protein [bacterium]